MHIVSFPPEKPLPNGYLAYALWLKPCRRGLAYLMHLSLTLIKYQEVKHISVRVCMQH